MGIRGLTTFVEKNFKRWHTVEVKGKMVIDGSSLLFTLYDLDWGHGGQYTAFKSNIQNFFQALKMSGISPIVVMDGVVEESKRPEIIRRRKDRVTSIDKLSSVERIEFLNGHGVLPPLVSLVFMTVLKEMKVDLTFADGEGDVAVYKLANGYDCPVLSNDSDFLIFNLRNGYIPLNHFRWKDSMPIKANVYYHTEFCSQFQLVDPRLRLLIPAITGNDFVEGIRNGNFLGLMNSFSPKLNHRHESIGVILNFIMQFSSLKIFKEKIKVVFDLEINVRESLIVNCSKTEELYDSDKVFSLEELKESTFLRLHSASKMPKWLLNQFRSGNLFTMHIVVTGKHILNVSVDDTSRTSSAMASKPIRKFMYGLIGWEKCVEMDRVGHGMEDVEVEASTILAEGTEIPRLVRVPTISALERSRMLFTILGCSDVEGQLGHLQKNWSLVLAATRFWYTQCSPTRQCVEALVLSFVFLSFTSVEALRSMNLRCPGHFRKSSAWMDLLHSYAQWQNIYGDAVKLNQLFKLPLKPMSPAVLFDGRLVMYVAGHDKRVVTDRLDAKAQALYKDLNGIVTQQLGTSSSPREHFRQHNAVKEKVKSQDSQAAVVVVGSPQTSQAAYGRGSPCKPKGSSQARSSSPGARPNPTSSRQSLDAHSPPKRTGGPRRRKPQTRTSPQHSSKEEVPPAQDMRASHQLRPAKGDKAVRSSLHKASRSGGSGH